MFSIRPVTVKLTVDLVRSCNRSALRNVLQGKVSDSFWGCETGVVRSSSDSVITSDGINNKFHNTAGLCYNHKGSVMRFEKRGHTVVGLDSNFGHLRTVGSLGVLDCHPVRFYRTASRHRSPSGSQDPEKSVNPKETSGVKTDSPMEETDKNLTVFQRFKKAYREHGKILIGVHLVTSTVWFSSFFYAASQGIDVVPWLEHIGLSETLIKPFRSPNVGNIAMAYLMYKLATPARYTVTLGGTNMVIRYMRRTGRMDPVPEGDTLRELYKDGRDQIRDRRHRIPRRHEKGPRQKVVQSHSHSSRTKH